MSLEITYYSKSVSGLPMYGAPISSETRTASGTSAQSAATPSNADVIRITSLAANRYAYGSSPTATSTAGANGHYIASGAVIEIDAVSGNKIAVITSA